MAEQERQQDPAVDRDEREAASSAARYGLDLFSEETPAAARRRYLLHALVYVIGLVLVVWPVLPAFNRVEPYVLGLPFVMFWSALSLVLVFVNTVALFRYEHGSLTNPTR